MMMDGRFDQHFAKLFAASIAEDGGKDGPSSMWPVAFASIVGLALFATFAVIG